MNEPAATARRHRLQLDLPPGWTVRATSGLGPFVTRAVLERPDGSVVEWTSRRHRKRLGLRPADGSTWRHGPLRAASGSSIAMGLLFMLGSACFFIGPMPFYASAVSESAVAWTFVVGSVFFTSAAYLQFREALVAPTGPDDDAAVPRGFRRIVAVWPHRIDWWAASIQLAGTLFFNLTTYAATRDALSVVQERRWIWAPDVFGSICFLVASWLAYVEASAGGTGWRHRGTGWSIAALNLVGSIAFGVSAVAARYLRATGEIANLAVANLGTVVGAACFFVGAALLPVESARDRSA
ncbi:MAG: YrhK family protein [Acidimicrobiales bacterium]|nr:YrhK family protein [Acidimicrobiales bacterium]